MKLEKNEERLIKKKNNVVPYLVTFFYWKNIKTWNDKLKNNVVSYLVTFFYWKNIKKNV